MNKVSREFAISNGLETYFTGLPCKYGHISKRHTLSMACYECKRLSNKRDRDSVRGRFLMAKKSTLANGS